MLEHQKKDRNTKLQIKAFTLSHLTIGSAFCNPLLSIATQTTPFLASVRVRSVVHPYIHMYALVSAHILLSFNASLSFISCTSAPISCEDICVWNSRSRLEASRPSRFLMDERSVVTWLRRTSLSLHMSSSSVWSCARRNGKMRIRDSLHVSALNLCLKAHVYLPSRGHVNV